MGAGSLQAHRQGTLPGTSVQATCRSHTQPRPGQTGSRGPGPWGDAPQCPRPTGAPPRPVPSLRPGPVASVAQGPVLARRCLGRPPQPLPGCPCSVGPQVAGCTARLPGRAPREGSPLQPTPSAGPAQRPSLPGAGLRSPPCQGHGQMALQAAEPAAAGQPPAAPPGQQLGPASVSPSDEQGPSGVPGPAGPHCRRAALSTRLAQSQGPAGSPHGSRHGCHGHCHCHPHRGSPGQRDSDGTGGRPTAVCAQSPTGDAPPSDFPLQGDLRVPPHPASSSPRKKPAGERTRVVAFSHAALAVLQRRPPTRQATPGSRPGGQSWEPEPAGSGRPAQWEKALSLGTAGCTPSRFCHR